VRREPVFALVGEEEGEGGPTYADFYWRGFLRKFVRRVQALLSWAGPFDGPKTDSLMAHCLKDSAFLQNQPEDFSLPKSPLFIP